MAAAASDPEVVCVGHRLAAASAAVPGEGTYVRDGHIHARSARHSHHPLSQPLA
jgi:exosome complex RNA-binding protein Csl4